MPTDVTPAPFRNEQNFPYAIERNFSGPHPGWAAQSLPAYHQAPRLMPVSSHSPPYTVRPIGPIDRPPRAIDCLTYQPEPIPGIGTGPGTCLPNGLRNPWAPYNGETYRPAAEGAAARQIHALNAGMGGVAGQPGQEYAGGSMYGGGGRTRSGYGGGYGVGSVIAPRAQSVASGSRISMMSGASLGGHRLDDGWEGSLGRRHAGIAPDMSSTAGAIPPSMPYQMGGASPGSWLTTPSSYQNHRRMTPGPPATLPIYTQRELILPPVAGSACSLRPGQDQHAESTRAGHVHIRRSESGKMRKSHRHEGHCQGVSNSPKSHSEEHIIPVAMGTSTSTRCGMASPVAVAAMSKGGTALVSAGKKV